MPTEKHYPEFRFKRADLGSDVRLDRVQGFRRAIHRAQSRYGFENAEIVTVHDRLSRYLSF
jgi:hypothetical protein